MIGNHCWLAWITKIGYMVDPITITLCVGGAMLAPIYGQYAYGLMKKIMRWYRYWRTVVHIFTERDNKSIFLTLIKAMHQHCVDPRYKCYKTLEQNIDGQNREITYRVPRPGSYMKIRYGGATINVLPISPDGMSIIAFELFSSLNDNAVLNQWLGGIMYHSGRLLSNIRNLCPGWNQGNILVIVRPFDNDNNDENDENTQGTTLSAPLLRRRAIEMSEVSH